MTNMPFFMLNLFILLAFNMTFLNKTYSDDERLYTLLNLQTLSKADAKEIQNYWGPKQINKRKIPEELDAKVKEAFNLLKIDSTASDTATTFQQLTEMVFKEPHPKWQVEIHIAMLSALTKGFYNLLEGEPIEADCNKMIQNEAVTFYNTNIKIPLAAKAASCNPLNPWI